jgi:putative DNA-invertase from lambdoid prophage Rac
LRGTHSFFKRGISIKEIWDFLLEQGILAEGLGLQGYSVVDRLWENDRSATGYLLKQEFEATRLLARLKAGDVVITPKLDRMFRSALDALDVLGRLKDRGVSLHMIDLGGDVTGNGVSKLVFTILSAVAEAERDRIRERIRDVKADQRKRQRYLGGIVPFGWRIGEDGALVEVPEQQFAIQRIVELRRKGLSLRAISASIAEDGVKLSHEGVKNVLAAANDPGAGPRRSYV